MTPESGRQYLAIPGPSALPDRVLSAMHRAAPNIYEGALPQMVEAMVPELKSVARTSADLAIYIANGHGIWEAALANVLGEGDLALVLATGRFAHGWGEMANGLGARTEILDFGLKAAIDPDRVVARLTSDSAREIKAILAVHVDTGTSIRNDIKVLRDAIDKTGHPALLMVDCIASLGCEVYEMDEWGVDVTISASQKGLMTPPGIGFVWFNDRAAAMRDAMPRVSRYWDWRPRAHPAEFYQYWDGTAPTHHLFALRAALDMIAEEGLAAIWDRHALIARAYWAAFDAWDAGPRGLALNVAEAALRSHAVTAVSCPAPGATKLREWVLANTGVTLGIGLGMAPPGDPGWHGHFRIGHMGHVNGHMALGVVGAIEAGLTALNIPHGGSGAAAAARVLAAGQP